jgi:hypothetical protein
MISWTEICDSLLACDRWRAPSINHTARHAEEPSPHLTVSLWGQLPVRLGCFSQRQARVNRRIRSERVQGDGRSKAYHGAPRVLGDAIETPVLAPKATGLALIRIIQLRFGGAGFLRRLRQPSSQPS